MSTEKIRTSHRERAAIVYVRQSSMQQVRNAREGQKRQYALQERAKQLGFERIETIDDDLGRSGSGSVDRPGFGRLLTAVCQGAVGAVFALEASRLARNNRDWHHLIDLCAMTDTLVIDEDGIYDPRHINDRLLLGLKGSMAEFELGLMRQRAREALLQMIGRGLVLGEVPVGYVRTELNGIEMIPDRQVQQAVRGVFARFHESGSARQTFLWYCQERIALPHVKAGTSGSEIVWRPPVYNHIIHMLKNPSYAGTFAHGRSTTRTVIRDGRARKTRGHAVPIEDWKVVIHDHHAGYITWDEFTRNQKLLRENLGKGISQSGAAKSGSALLAGLLRCARCGRKLHVAYGGIGGRVARYACRGGHISHGQEKCISVGGLRLDEAVAEQVLEALQPIGIDAALDAEAAAGRADADKRTALTMALDKARFEADRRHRQFDAVDPGNRLVAEELESRWNEALRRVAELESRLTEMSLTHDEVSPDQRRRLLDLGADLKAMWCHCNAPVSLKKRIMRTVLEEIVIDIHDSDPPKVHLRLHWAGGVHTELLVAKNRTGRHQRSTDREIVGLVRELAKVCRDRKIAAILNRLGYRTGAGNTWKESRVAGLRHYQQIPTCATLEERTWLTLAEAAAELGVSTSVVRRLIREKVVLAEQVVKCAPYVIERQSLASPAVQSAVQAVRSGRRTPRTAPGQMEFPFD
jgi:DNA invertase Pin-like site-specific DNA recombinase